MAHFRTMSDGKLSRMFVEARNAALDAKHVIDGVTEERGRRREVRIAELTIQVEELLLEKLKQ